MLNTEPGTEERLKPCWLVLLLFIILYKIFEIKVQGLKQFQMIGLREGPGAKDL